MNYLILFLKGIIIGIGKIIPGVSGAHIAMVLHVYEESVYKLSNIKENICYFFALGIGILLSIVLMSPLILYLINNYYLFTMSFFLGLLIKSIDLNSEHKLKIIFGSLIVLLMYLFVRIPSITINNIFVSFILGVIESITSIIPGISGTATYMVLGCYDKVLELFSFSKPWLLLSFVIGVIVSSLLIIKGISCVLKRNSEVLKWIIQIFMLSSLLYLFVKMVPFITSYNFLSVICLGVIGYTIASIIE